MYVLVAIALQSSGSAPRLAFKNEIQSCLCLDRKSLARERMSIETSLSRPVNV
jgi:hypothetical protein